MSILVGSSRSTILRQSVAPWSLSDRPVFTCNVYALKSGLLFVKAQTHPIRKRCFHVGRLASAMIKSPLEVRLASILEKRRRESKLRSLKSSPSGSVDFSSNDFLSLATNHEFRQDYLNALNGAEVSIGSTGSRLLDGNSTVAESLECQIAAFHGADAGLLTNSGFDANVSIFTCLPQLGDVIIYDELIHASVHDGMRQSRAKTLVKFKHNDATDLGRVLKGLKQDEPDANFFVAVESVYSMEGDLAPLSEMADVLDHICPDGRGHLIVDEAHATGIYGPNGTGRVSELGLEDRVSIRLHTFGKALASSGAIILCSPTIRLYLINYARPLIYTTFMSYPSLIAIHTAYEWLRKGKVDALTARLNTLMEYLYQRLHTLAPLLQPLHDQSILVLPDECSRSPIFALLSTTPRELAAHCQSAGFVVRAVVPPTVPDGTERVRVCLHAGNTEEQIDKFIESVAEWIRLQSPVTDDLGIKAPGSSTIGRALSSPRVAVVEAAPAHGKTEAPRAKL